MPNIAVDPGSLADAGDIPLGLEAQEARSAIEAALTRIVGECAAPFSLGGDPSVTYPVLRACRALAPVTILHVDAHGDLYDQFPLPEPHHGLRRPLLARLSVRPHHGIVEYNPTNDVRDLTARVAAKLVKEVAAVATRNGGTARVARNG